MTRAGRVAVRVALLGGVLAGALGCGAEPTPARPPTGTTPATDGAAARTPRATPMVAAAPPAPGVAPLLDEAAAFARARARHQGVLVEVTATWCLPCAELRQALATPQVQAVLAPAFTWLTIDATEDSPASVEARARYGAATLPALVFVDGEGRVVGRVTQLLDPEALAAEVRAAAARLPSIR